MKINNPFKNKGFRVFIWKGALSVFIVYLVQIILQTYLLHTAFFSNYLDIPQAFQLGKGVIFLSITNTALFGFVVFVMLTYKELFKVEHYKFEYKQMVFLFITIVFLALHYILKYLISQNLEYFSQAPLFWGIIKVVIQIFFILSIVLMVYGKNFIVYLLAKFKKQIVITLLVSVSFFILMLLVQNLWTYFSSVISNILYHVFSLFFNNVTYQPFVTSFTMTEGGGPLLGIGSFKAIIGKPCSGIDSFLLFTSLYTLIFILDYKRLKKGLTTVLFFVGALGMFITNILRILLLFIVGAYIDPKFAVGMFHTNAGWILFIFYFFIFWYFASKFVYVENKE